jgi:hypothetical protein
MTYVFLIQFYCILSIRATSTTVAKKQIDKSGIFSSVLILDRKISFDRWKVDLSSFRVRFRKILCNKLLGKFVYSYVTTICSLHGSSIFLFWSFKELSALLCKKKQEKNVPLSVNFLYSWKNYPGHEMNTLWCVFSSGKLFCFATMCRQFLHLKWSEATLAYFGILLHLSVQAKLSPFILRVLLHLTSCWSLAALMKKASSCKVLADTPRHFSAQATLAVSGYSLIVTSPFQSKGFQP